MSNKLNAEELAYDRRVGLLWTPDMERSYALAIREVAQPIADQRDELLEALNECKRLVYGVRALGKYPEGLDHAIIIADKAIAKCTSKP